MATKLPEILKGFALIVDSQGYGGRCSELKLPNLQREMEGYRAGAMDRELEMDMGGPGLTAEFTLDEYTPAIIEQWGLTTVDGVSIRFKGSVKADDNDGDEIPIEVVMRGRFKEIDQGDWKPKEGQKMKVVASLAFYEYIYNGKQEIKIDVLEGVEIVNGVDRLSTRQANLAP
jgi:hypothetical protein